MAVPVEFVQQLLKQQQEQFELLIQRLSVQRNVDNTKDSTVETLFLSISEFHYQPDDGITFDSWYHRYEDILKVDGATLDESARVRLLLRKLGPAEYERYCNFILPKHPRDLDLAQTVTHLSSIFGERSSLFNTRYKCLKLSKTAEDDYISYAGRVNRECERFKLQSLTNDQFKTLIFVCGLHSPADSDIRTRLLSKLETDPEITLQQITEECQRLLNLKHDTQMIQKTDVHPVTEVNALAASRGPRYPQSTFRNRPRTACWHCGLWHFAKFCTYKSHKCKNCGRIGHKESVCRGCPRQNTYNGAPARRRSASNLIFAMNALDFKSRRKYISICINSQPVKLQVDTASDVTIISEATWISLGRPAIAETDHIARTASGEQLPFVGEFQCTFSFRNSQAHGTCYVSKLDHLNLLGIDWIERLNLWQFPFSEICDSTECNLLSDSAHINTAAPVNSSDMCTIISHLKSDYPHVFEDSLRSLPVTATMIRQETSLMDQQIEQVVKNCHNCQMAAKLPPKAEPQSKQSKPQSKRDTIKSQNATDTNGRFRVFNTGDPVYVRNFRNGLESWIPGEIVKRDGTVTYKVKVGSFIWTRHVNHIRPRNMQYDTVERSSESIPMDILVDHRVDRTSPEDTNSTDAHEQPYRRYSRRTRAPIHRLSVYPRNRIYDTTVACLAETF